MSMCLKDVLTATLVALSLSLSGPGNALADDDSDYSSSRHHGHQNKHQDRHRKEWRHHKKHQRKHYRERHHNDHHERSYGRHVTNVYRHDDDDGEKLLIGLLVGGLVGYAINESQQSYDDAGTDYTYTAPVRVINTPTVISQRNNGCLQEREYQTRVTVGGRQVDAYGTACLQPDGSWMRGPAHLAAY